MSGMMTPSAGEIRVLRGPSDPPLPTQQSMVQTMQPVPVAQQSQPQVTGGMAPSVVTLSPGGLGFDPNLGAGLGLPMMAEPEQRQPRPASGDVVAAARSLCEAVSSTISDQELDRIRARFAAGDGRSALRALVWAVLGELVSR